MLGGIDMFFILFFGKYKLILGLFLGTGVQNKIKKGSYLFLTFGFFIIIASHNFYIS